MSLLGWLMLIAAVVSYVRYGAGIRERIIRFVRSGSESSVNPKRMLGSLVIALLVGAATRFLLGSFLPINAGNQLLTSFATGPEGGKADLAGGGSIVVPAGALEKSTTISVQKRSTEQRGDASSSIPPGALCVYELSPIDAALRAPIELDLPVPTGQNVSVFVTANGQSRILPAAITGQTAHVSISNLDLNQPGAVDVAR